jgi:3-oxoacyl-[acyl-carrier-protein] synthase I
VARAVGNDATVVSGIGLHSSLGGAVPAAAAFRCGMSRACALPEWPYFDEVEQDDHFFTGNQAAGVAAGFQGIARLLKLGTMALADLRRGVDLSSLPSSRLGFTLVLAADQADEERDPNELVTRLCRTSGLDLPAAHLRTSFQGRVGVAAAIRDAQQVLVSGQFDHVIVGAIDTFLTVDRMAELIETRTIKSVDNPVGMVPGEAASFVLLESMRQVRRRGGSAGAIVQSPVAIAPRDPAAGSPGEEAPTPPDSVSRPGQSLTKLMLTALRAAGGDAGARGILYADLNGTTPRALEFGSALVQVSLTHPLEHWHPVFPAASFGETGAASGLVATCLAVRAFAREPEKGRLALVITSCETGGDAAFALGSAE